MDEQKSDIRTVARPNCLLCALQGEVLYEGLVDPFFGAPGTWRTRRCAQANCGLIWLDPAPVPEDLHLAYKQYFTHVDGEAGKPAGARLRDMLYRTYQVVSAIPAALVGLQRARRQARRMFLEDAKPGKLLDVGCGDGLFLSRMRDLGWSVDGVDFDQQAIAAAKAKFGLQLKHGDLEGAKFPDNHFDAVTLSHVIEHVPDPVRLLLEVRRILKTGGTMVLTTPNSASLGHRKFGPYWFGIDAPRHLNIFSVENLKEVAKRGEFSNIEAFSTVANADIFLGASYSIRDSRDHHAAHEPPPNLLRTVRAMAGQYREHIHLGRNNSVGEEAVLLCRQERHG